MECFLCERDATRECARCGAVYCDEHGDALCERCSDPELALPSNRLYRGSLLALLAGSLFTLWLLIRPPEGDLDALAASATPDPAPATLVLAPDDPSPSPTSTATPTAATPAPSATATPSPTASPSPTPTPTRTPAPTPTPTPESDYFEYTVESGDTFGAIVSRFVPEDEDFADFADRIIDINDIADSKLLSIGQVLQIPRE